MTQTTSWSPKQSGPHLGDPGQSSGIPDPRLQGMIVPSSRREARAAISGRRWAAVHSALEGTPGRLRLTGIGVILACLVLSLLGAMAFSTRENALAEARSDAAQLIRVQEIAAQLVKADSLFTNGYLAYGLEPPQNLAAYDTAVRVASTFIVEASQANGEDAKQLEVVNVALAEYTARVASARSNNNQGYQVATGYLRQASDLLRGNTATGVRGMLPILEDLRRDNGTRVDDAYSSSRQATWMFVGTALLTLGGLAIGQVRLARMSRRYLNLPLAGASGVAFLVLAVGAVVMVTAQSNANRVYDGSYTNLRKIATARIQAYTAKSAESISLIYRGTGGDFVTADKRYADATAEAASQLVGLGGVNELAAWREVHQEVFERAATRWQEAAKEATSAGSDATPTINSTFTTFDSVTWDLLEAQAGEVGSGLSSGHVGLLLLTWIAVAGGLLAAAMAWAGVSQRLEEYR